MEEKAGKEKRKFEKKGREGTIQCEEANLRVVIKI